MNKVKSYRATLGGLYVMAVYMSIGQVTVTVDANYALNLTEEQAKWLIKNTEAKVVKTVVTVEEIELIRRDVIDEK